MGKSCSKFDPKLYLYIFGRMKTKKGLNQSVADVANL
jgi:hypothetical protein